jgi:3-methyladenine DNA glycosylase/8-oxoguanine DNA glycosylase
MCCNVGKTRLAAETGPVRIPRPRSTHFASLVQAIVYQQLATAAAHAIHGRLVDALGGTAGRRTNRASTESDQHLR